MDYLKSVFGRIQIKLAIIGSISLCLAIIITLACVHITRGITGDNMAERWSGDGRYAKESIFFGDLASFTESSAKQLEYSINKKLSDDSIVADNPGARTWVYTYSTVKNLSVKSQSFSAQVKTYAVGNDFFLFHPMNTVSGSLFSGTELNDDLVVVDKDVAWTLFGSNDIVGQYVEIAGKEFVVAGVIDRESGKLNDLAGNNEPSMFISFSAMSSLMQDLTIQTLEVVMPNPISNYAYDIVKDSVSEDEERYELIENTSRYHFTKLLMSAKNFVKKGMNAKAVKYPYWENISRGMENILAPICVLVCLFYLFPAVLLIMLVSRMWRKRTVHKGDIKDYVERKVEKARMKRSAKKRERNNE